MQQGLFDEAEARRRRDEAIENVARGADSDWMRAAINVIINLAFSPGIFTTDDVWARLTHLDPPREPRAMGAAITAVRKMGCIKSTDRMIKSVRVACHRRPLTVWKGL